MAITEGGAMPGITSFPCVVRDAVERFGDLFACEIPNVHHKVRIVIIWNKKRDREPRKILVTNRVGWEVLRILQVYRYG